MFQLTMLSIEKCNEILNKFEKNYTQDQVKSIRYFLYQLAQIEYKLSKSKKLDGSSDLHKSLNR